MRNIRLVIAYDGTDFHGWQRQPDLPTIQGFLESAVEKIVGERITLNGSGRTDAGVHAANQVASFRTNCKIPCPNLLKALNNLLPPSVRIKSAENAAEPFHARYDARSKTYRYRVLLAPIASPFMTRFVYHHPYPIDRKQMAAAARLLEGEHDFASFAAANSDDGRPDAENFRQREPKGNQASSAPDTPPPTSHTPASVRTIFSSRILWRPRSSILVYEVRGSGFLHHMVRNIVGTLLEVGVGKLSPQDVVSILEARDRTRAGPTAPASGLSLMKVEY